MNAPIALFVYNRPTHTRQTVEALIKNALSEDSNLFIFSDAPKTEMQAKAVNEVRQYICQIDGFKTVTIVEREANFGLARSIIDGVSKLCKEYGRVIVLEDDLVTSPYFLKYMNDALDMYKDAHKVMHISGATYPIEDVKGETFFLRVPLCWGWGTWARAWQYFAKDIRVMKQFDRQMISEFDFDGTYPYWRQLELNRRRKLDTWFVFWYATLFLNDGLALFPGKSLVNNIGMDSSGVHCGTSKDFEIAPSNAPIELSTIPLVESEEAVRQHKLYFRRVYPALYLRAIRKAIKIIKGER